MVICGSNMFGFSVSTDIKKNNDIWRISPTNLIAYILTLIIKELNISIQQGGNNIKYSQTLDIIFSVVENNVFYTHMSTLHLNSQHDLTT
jgi:hypothetical protein